MENKGCCAEKPADNTCSTEKTGACGSKGKCCPTTILKGALIGGIAMFLYFSASWMAPWHKTDIMALGNERMAATLLANLAPQPGIYVLPKVVDIKTGAVGPSAVAKPYAFISVFPDGIQSDDFKREMVRDFLLCLFGAALLTKILKKRNQGCCPVAGSMAIGLLVAIFSYLPNMIWFHFPLHYSLVGMADDFIAITLAGAVIGKCVLKAGPCTMGKCCDKSKCDDKKGDCGDKTGSCSDKKGSCH